MRASRALSSRAAVLQDVLTAHPAVATARTFAADGEAVHAVILPVDGTDGTLISLISDMLSDGSLQRVSMRAEPEELPAAPHEQVVLSDLLQALHRAVDSDGDGKVTRAELQSFLEAHGLLHLAPLLAETTPETLTFSEFKNYLLDTHIVSFAPGESNSVFGVHISLVWSVSECFFDSADADGDGQPARATCTSLAHAHARVHAPSHMQAASRWTSWSSSSLLTEWATRRARGAR